MNKIIYNNLELPSPTPFFSLERGHEYVGKKIGNIDKITLDGTLTGNFNQLIQYQKDIVNIFSKNFGELRVTEDSTVIYQKSNIVLENISFDEANYNGILNYKIDLSSSQFINSVIEPENSFSFSEEEDRILSLNHTISAKGVNTNSNNLKSNALDNAINFVNNYTGLNSIPTTKFFGQKNNKFNLKTQIEKIDRLNAKYSIEEGYVNDLNSSLPQDFISRYTVDIESGVDKNLISLKLNGQIDGSLTGQISQIRNGLAPLNLISEYISSYQINPTPLSYTIDESTNQKNLKFSYEFDNSPFPNPHATYSISVQESAIDQIVKIFVNIRVQARGNLNLRKNLLSSFSPSFNLNEVYSTYVDLYSKQNIKNNTNFRLVKTQSKTNLDNSEKTIALEYDNKNTIGGFYESSFEITEVYPQSIILPEPTCNVYAKYAFVDFGATSLGRRQVSVNGEVMQGMSTESLKSYLTSLFPPGGDFPVINITASETQGGLARKNISYSSEAVYENSSTFIPKIT